MKSALRGKFSLRNKLTIKSMLVIWAVTGIAAVVVLGGAGIFSNDRLSTNQDRLIGTFPFEEASRNVSVIVTDLIVRQSRILASGSTGELKAVPSRKPLEEAFEKERGKLGGLEKTVPGVKAVLEKMDGANRSFLKLDAALYEKTMNILSLKERLKERGKAIDAAVREIQNTAEGITGKINFTATQGKLKIRRVINNPEKSEEFRGLVSDFLLGKQADIQQQSGEIRTRVTSLATLSRQIMLENSGDVLRSIKDNEMAQDIQQVRQTLDSFKHSFEGNAELQSLTENLRGSFNRLVAMLIEGGDSAYAMRLKSIAEEKELEGLLGSVKQSVVSMTEGIGQLTGLAGAVRTSAARESTGVISRSRTTVITVGAVTLSLLLLLTMVITRSISTPVRDAARLFSRLGEGDLTVHIEAKRQDEIGQMLIAMKNMVERLRETVSMVADSTRKVNASASEISAAVEQEMAVATEQAASVTEITATMEELSATSTQIAENSNAVLNVSTNTTDVALKMSEAVETLIGKMNEIYEDNQRGIEEIVELGKKSQEITKVMEVINNIADQTKLIAFNAAIEAAAAGEAGKRFGVVAVEIRRLADSVMESTEGIRAKIGDIQGAVNNLVISSEKGSKGIKEGIDVAFQAGNTLDGMVSGAHQTTDAAKQITLSTQQQKSASEQVLLSLKEISEGARQISASFNQTTAATRNLLELSGSLVTLIEKFKLNEGPEV